MFHIRGECQQVRNGFNFYPWRERKWSIGFLFVWNDFALWCRYAPHVHRFYCSAERCGVRLRLPTKAARR